MICHCFMRVCGFVHFYLSPVWASGYHCCFHLSVCPSINKFVCTMTHHLFKLGSPNLDQRCKRPWFWGWLALNFKVKFSFKSCLFASLLRLWNFCETYKNSLLNCSPSPSHICWIPYAWQHGPWTSLMLWDYQSSVSSQLDDWHWNLQAAIVFCQITRTSHAKTPYATFSNHLSFHLSLFRSTFNRASLASALF